jgi:small-conductance mechanosensitive channel
MGLIMLDLEILFRIAGVIATLIAAWLVGRTIKKGHAKLLKKGAIGKLLLSRFTRMGIYLVTIGIILWISNFPSLWSWLQDTYPLVAKLVEVAILWIVAIWIIRNFLDVLTKLEKAKVKRIPGEVNLLIRKIFKYSVCIIAILWTLAIFGLIGAIQGLLVGAGLAAIIIGFAARDVLSNLLAGISLLIDRPFKIGDWIHLKGKDLVGHVKEMSLRSTTIIAPDNTPINLPNSMVANEAIVNYSAHRLRRFFLEVRISYESDVAKAIKVIKETLEKDPATAKNGVEGEGYFAPIEIVVTDFGESSVNMQAKVFIDTTLAGGLFETKSRMLANIKKALIKNGIEIPYPRRYVIMDKKS